VGLKGKNKTARELSFSLREGYANDVRCMIMRVRCAKCGNYAEVKPWEHGYTTHYVQHYWRHERGWEFSAHNKRACICPDCKKKGVIMATPPKPEPPRLRPVEVPAALPEVIEMPAPVPAVLSREQRHQVRKALENHFDDEIGRYRRDWSDKRISEHLDLPEASVRNIREAAYGPLSETDPDLVQLRKDFNDLRGLLNDIEQRLQGLERRHG
jgi:hypothetical protein